MVYKYCLSCIKHKKIFPNMDENLVNLRLEYKINEYQNKIN